MYNEYKPIYNIAKYMARNYYTTYRGLFFLHGYERVDIEQEACLEVAKVLNRFKDKPFEEKFKLCNNAIGWRMNSFIKGLKVRQSVAQIMPIPENQMYKYDKHLDPLNGKISGNGHNGHDVEYLYDKFKKVLSKQEADILIDHLGYERNYDEIGKTLGVSKQRVEKVCKRALRKCRKLIQLEKIEFPLN